MTGCPPLPAQRAFMSISSPPQAIDQPALRTRNPQVDNAKFVLIALVVIGHGMGALRGHSPLLKAAYHFIYLFHIPAFVYLSGSLARARFDTRQGLRWLCTLVVPLLVFQAIYQAWNAWLLHDAFTYRITVPYWLLWYLGQPCMLARDAAADAGAGPATSGRERDRAAGRLRR